jgi:hypothetical protein
MSFSLRHGFTRETTIGPSRVPGIGKYRLIRPPGETPYFASLDTPLFQIGKDISDTRQACESYLITGGIGSGKTSTSIRAILTAYLQAGFGGAYFSAKRGAGDLLREIARDTGRLSDIVTFDASAQSARMNVLDVASAQFRGNATSLVGLMAVIIEAGRKASGTAGGGDGENRFFTEGAMKDMAHAFALLQEIEGSIKMRSVYAFLTSVPQTPAEAKSTEWMQTSYCGRTLTALTDRLKSAKAQGSPDFARLARLWNDCGEYFTGEVARLDNRPKTSITATFSNNIYHFLHNDLNRLFCTDTTVTPLDARRGKILLVDLPALQFGAGAVIAAVILKFLCSMSWQSEERTDDMRPVFIMADEAQTYLDSTDADTLATGRDARISVTYATQDIPTLYAKLGATGRDAADSLIAKFGTRIVHANTCPKTNEMFANMIGKVEKFHRTESRSRGSTTGSGDNRHDHSGAFSGHTGANQNTSESTSGYMDWEFPPSDFATLKTGGTRNKKLCEAVIIRNGRRWRTSGKHWMLMEMKQQ